MEIKPKKVLSEEQYFRKAYRDKYLERNPPKKLQTYLSTILKYKPRGCLLDIGCAFGLFVEMASYNFEAEGIDISSYTIGIAKERAPKCRFYVSDILKFTSKKKYDVITSFDTLEHIPELDKSLKKIKSLLNEKGILALVIPVYDGPLGQIVKLLDHDPTHIHLFTREQWIEKMKEYRFRILFYEGHLRYLLLNRRYIFYRTKLLRKWMPAIF